MELFKDCKKMANTGVDGVKTAEFSGVTGIIRHPLLLK